MGMHQSGDFGGKVVGVDLEFLGDAFDDIDGKSSQQVLRENIGFVHVFCFLQKQ